MLLGGCAPHAHCPRPDGIPSQAATPTQAECGAGGSGSQLGTGGPICYISGSCSHCHRQTHCAVVIWVVCQLPCGFVMNTAAPCPTPSKVCVPLTLFKPTAYSADLLSYVSQMRKQAWRSQPTCPRPHGWVELRTVTPQPVSPSGMSRVELSSWGRKRERHPGAGSQILPMVRRPHAESH